MKKIPFKEYNQGQTLLFPPEIGSLIPQNAPARYVNKVVDNLDISSVLSTYKGGGTSSYHPKMMLKILFFAYMNNIFSCRKIAKQLTENINYMWLAGMQQPDFRTINGFRSNRLKDVIHQLFTQVVIMLCEADCLSLEEAFIDGTKIESRANKYTFVWRKNTERYQKNLKEKINSILSQIEEGIAQDTDYKEDSAAENAPEISMEELAKRAKAINKETLTKEDAKKLQNVENKLLPKLQEYEQQAEIHGERNSYSKTDPDATFMRMKEDAMNNGQTKPGYNLQIATSKQFITEFDLFHNPTDTLTLIPFLETIGNAYGHKLTEVTADSGYGSEENYMYLEASGIEAYVKYNYFHKEQHRPFKTNPFIVNNLYYNKENDYYVCPMGQHMVKVGNRTSTTETGYKAQITVYEAQNCNACPLRGQCFKGKGNRKIQVNHNLNRLKEKAFGLLTSEAGLERRSRRPIEPEAVFGQIKTCMGYKRFRHFGKQKCLMDFGILAIAFNLLKKWRLDGHGLPKRLKNCLFLFLIVCFGSFFQSRRHSNSFSLQIG